MLSLVRSIVSVLACRFRSRADLELEVLALRRQLNVLRRQRPGHLRLSPIEAPIQSTVDKRTLAVGVTSRTVRRRWNPPQKQDRHAAIVRSAYLR
jgi:hypothetical protein